MKKILTIIALICFSGLLFGQEVSSSVVASSGKSVKTDDVQVSWTVGEVAVETIGTKGETPILSQGFQQGYTKITSIDDRPINSDFNIKIYPNPAIEYIWIEIDAQQDTEAIIEIYTMDGKMVYNKKWQLIDGAQQVNINSLNASQYILRVTETSGKILQTFKLMKQK